MLHIYLNNLLLDAAEIFLAQNFHENAQNHVLKENGERQYGTVLNIKVVWNIEINSIFLCC
jgi:hypothetical protein